MQYTRILPHPITLVCGCLYRRLERNSTTGAARFTLVCFLAYTASPAFVVVLQEEKRLRCPRADLFDPEKPPLASFCPE
jgi:hypothetical protein